MNKLLGLLLLLPSLALADVTGGGGGGGGGGGTSTNVFIGTNALQSMTAPISTPYTNNYPFPVLMAGGSVVINRAAVAGVVAGWQDLQAKTSPYPTSQSTTAAVAPRWNQR